MASRLAEFRIEGLFGLYAHKIALNSQEHITIIIGPNGRGKTVCLKFIEALFHKKFSFFRDIPFEIAEFVFAGGEIIKLEKILEKTEDEERNSPIKLKFTLNSQREKTLTWSPAGIDINLRRQVRRYLPGDWEHVSDDIWIDRSDGEQLTTTELLHRYQPPPKLIAGLLQTAPQPFAKLIDGIDCHLIETQRLLVFPSSPAEDDLETAPYRVRRRARHSNLAIQQKAQALKTILQNTITNYANLSQSLDRTFPFRVFEAQGSPSSSQEGLRLELKSLDDRREALMSAGILDAQHEAVTLRSGNIEPGVARALEIYVTDAVRKLDVFNELRGRLDLFKQIIETRFIDKTIHIDRESGFKITSKTGLNIPLDKLSSGEQHQLILVFDLLFEVRANSLILIDEPELSLHVAWQKTFIESLKRIIALNTFDVLIATHSPAVVARHFSLVVELGSIDE
jgi:energy-coupling factor transporter ATP-binding protein EcfA2